MHGVSVIVKHARAAEGLSTILASGSPDLILRVIRIAGVSQSLFSDPIAFPASFISQMNQPVVVKLGSEA